MTRILIAEDDPEIAMLEQDYLELEGFQVTVVDNGQRAVTEALNGDYSLILLDLMLPGCNGLDICRLIRDRIDIPIRPSRVGGQDTGIGVGGGRLHCQAL